jgi:uncharacterized phage protein (TIGR02218 family)
MRDIPAELALHLKGEVTTCCRCWRATRRDGLVLGFTDHDEDVVFDGTAYRAASGLDAAEASSDFGFAVGGGEVAGALGSDSLTEEDLCAGLWDSARAETMLVNWNDPSQGICLNVGEIGDVRRGGAAFTAELRSMSHRLEARTGRLYAARCDAELGDARCRKNIDTDEFRGAGAVLSVASRFEVVVTGLAAFASGSFTGGTLTWMAGANAGQGSAVREHRGEGAVARIGFWQAAGFTVAEGDAFTVHAGCDKAFETCRDRFANVVNFRGFPHMPGTDRALGYPTAEDGDLDGGSLFQ